MKKLLYVLLSINLANISFAQQSVEPSASEGQQQASTNETSRRTYAMESFELISNLISVLNAQQKEVMDHFDRLFEPSQDQLEKRQDMARLVYEIMNSYYETMQSMLTELLNAKTGEAVLVGLSTSLESLESKVKENAKAINNYAGDENLELLVSVSRKFLEYAKTMVSNEEGNNVLKFRIQNKILPALSEKFEELKKAASKYGL